MQKLTLEKLKQQKIEAKRIEDSIAKVNENARLQVLKQLALKKERDKFVADSLVKAKREAKRLQKIAQKEAEIALALKEEEQRQAAAAAEKAANIAAKEKEKAALAAKVKLEADRKRAEIERLEAIALKTKQDAENNQKQLDSIALAKTQEKQELARALQIARQQIEALKIQRIKDSLAKAKIEKQLALKAETNNSTATIQEKAIAVAEKEIPAKTHKAPSNLCAYQINEFDRFYNIRTIRTERYDLAKDLTVELHRQGYKTSVFFNLSKNLGCASYLPNQRSTVKVTLENNKVVSFYHSWDIECGEFLFKASLSSSKVLSLKQSPIKSIQLKGTKSTLKITDVTNKTFFIEMLTCID